MRRPGAALSRDAGFALLIVLWALVLLSLILTQLLSAGRSEAQLAGNLRSAAVAEAVADGGISDAVYHLLGTGSQAWPARGTHVLHLGRGVAEISIENLAGKVNPNTASPPLLQVLIGLCRRSSQDAMRLAQAIIGWHSAPDNGGQDPAVAGVAYRAAGLSYAPPGLPFQTDDELRLVVGMTPATYACLAQHMSIYQDSEPSSRSDDPVVARALAMLAQQGAGTTDPGPAPPADVVRITSAATAAGGRFVRRATVRLTAGSDGLPFRILTWDSPGG